MDALASLSFLPLRFSRNQIAYTLDAAPDSITARLGLQYFLIVKKPKSFGSGTYEELISLEGRELPKRTELGSDIYPGAEFDIAVFIDDCLRRTVPQPDQACIVVCSELVTPFMVCTLIENDDISVGAVKNLPIEYALKAGLSIDQFATWRERFFTDYLASARRFLTWQPAEKWVDVGQPEFLYYLVNFTPKPTELRLRVDVAYADGSTETLMPLCLTTVSQYGVYSIPVGFTALGLPAREAATQKQVQSYQVWVANESNARLSEVRTYFVQRDYDPNVLYLVYANSLGGYDTLRCTGQSSRTLTVKGTAAQRALRPNYLPTAAELYSLNRLGENVLTVNTGLLDGADLNYLSELALTEEVYVATADGLVALLPTDTALPLRTDDEDLAGRTLSFTYAKREVGFSQLPPLPSSTTAARPTVWVPSNTFCLINENGLRTGYLAAAKLELHYADDGSLVKPLRSKANTPGTEGYTAPTLSGACSSTPYVNALVQQPGTYKRANCGSDEEGQMAMLTILAGTYGAETPEQLQARVDQALLGLNTQAYANQYGACLANPTGYSYSVPANRFHYRSNVPSRIGIETAESPYMGNAWTMQSHPGTFVYATGSNDLDFPTTSFDANQWRLFTYGTPGASARLRIYKNGTIYLDKTFAFNPDGFEYHGLFTQTDGSLTTVASLDKLYVQLINL